MTTMRWLLDTNICIYAMSDRHVDLTKRLDALDAGQAGISVVVLGELQFGIAKSSRPDAARDRLQALLQVAPPVPLPVDAGEHYGRIRATLQLAGMPIGNNDLWIAAHARASRLCLVTNNLREFQRVPGLALENWII